MNANAGRDDLNHLLRARHVPAGEPIFYLRGRDPAAFAGVLAYAATARTLGVPLAVVEQALQQADAIDAFGPKRLPDTGHLAPHQVLQLEYQFSRRAWRARPEDGAIAAAELMLAERRGWDAAMASVRVATVTTLRESVA